MMNCRIIILLYFILCLQLYGCGSSGDDGSIYYFINKTDPASGAVDVMEYGFVGVTFTEKMDSLTVNDSTFKLFDDLGNPVQGGIYYGCGLLGPCGIGSTYRAIFQSQPLKPATSYTAVITKEMKTDKGDALPDDYTWNFTTRLDAGIGDWFSISDAYLSTPVVGDPLYDIYDSFMAWTGNEVLVLRDLSNSMDSAIGAIYNPDADSWREISNIGAPLGRVKPSVIWTGNEMIIWGGRVGSEMVNTGAIYNPATDLWRQISVTDAPTARFWHNAVWTGTEMLVWGGREISSDTLAVTGGRYNPVTDSWSSMSTNNAPDSDSSLYDAIWTGTEMIVWGGKVDKNVEDYDYDNNGGRYNPDTDTWERISTSNAPSGRRNFSTIWTGHEMIVWGGESFVGIVGGDSNLIFHNTGARYNPVTDVWQPTSTVNTPPGRSDHIAIWTGSQMVVWGGEEIVKMIVGTRIHHSHLGGVYDPSADSWQLTSITNVPQPSIDYEAVWAGNQMIIWSKRKRGARLDFSGY